MSQFGFRRGRAFESEDELSGRTPFPMRVVQARQMAPGRCNHAQVCEDPAYSLWPGRPNPHRIELLYSAGDPASRAPAHDCRGECTPFGAVRRSCPSSRLQNHFTLTATAWSSSHEYRWGKADLFSAHGRVESVPDARRKRLDLKSPSIEEALCDQVAMRPAVLGDAREQIRRDRWGPRHCEGTLVRSYSASRPGDRRTRYVPLLSTRNGPAAENPGAGRVQRENVGPVSACRGARSAT